MRALAVIGTCVVGALIGGVIGVYHGSKEGGDFMAFGEIIDGAIGLVLGGFAGVVVGAVMCA